MRRRDAVADHRSTTRRQTRHGGARFFERRATASGREARRAHRVLKTEKTNLAPARVAAFDILWRVATEDAFASNLLASPRYDRLSREDHGLAQELSLGVLRWQIRLDFLIERYARRSLDKLDPEVVVALRLGLYQLKFLSRIPPHAAINESVNLVKQRGKKSAAPLVNAALRAAQREAALDLNQAIKDPVEKLSVETAHRS